MAKLKIGALAERTGTSAPTIRYYEEIGLLRSAYRQSGGQRVQGPV
jgi:DNA-binding transcriptional MerR regulator